MQPPEYDNYDEYGAPRPRRADILWNLLSIVALLGIVGIVALVMNIYQNPESSVNPFPPPTLPAALVLPTSTPTQRVLPPTWTPTASLTPTQPEPTDTLEAPTLPVANSTPQANTTTTALSNAAYVLQGDPVPMSSSLFHPTGGCQWFGVGGNVFDLSGRPVFGLVVTLGGSLNGSPIQSQTTLTGMARNYGESGYEFTIQSTPVASTGSLWIQLSDQSQVPASDRIYFNTYSDCQHNLILINFKQAK